MADVVLDIRFHTHQFAIYIVAVGEDVATNIGLINNRIRENLHDNRITMRIATLFRRNGVLQNWPEVTVANTANPHIRSGVLSCRADQEANRGFPFPGGFIDVLRKLRTIIDKGFTGGAGIKRRGGQEFILLWFITPGQVVRIKVALEAVQLYFE